MESSVRLTDYVIYLPLLMIKFTLQNRFCTLNYFECTNYQSKESL